MGILCECVIFGLYISPLGPLIFYLFVICFCLFVVMSNKLIYLKNCKATIKISHYYIFYLLVHSSFESSLVSPCFYRFGKKCVIIFLYKISPVRLLWLSSAVVPLKALSKFEKLKAVSEAVCQI